MFSRENFNPGGGGYLVTKFNAERPRPEDPISGSLVLILM